MIFLLQSAFQVYYDSAMPYLKHIYQATDGTDLMLHAKTMDCISVIGLAVGKDKFSQDAKEVMSVICLLYLPGGLLMCDFDFCSWSPSKDCSM